MKKCVSVILAALLLLGAMAVHAAAEEEAAPALVELVEFAEYAIASEEAEEPAAEPEPEPEEKNWFDKLWDLLKHLWSLTEMSPLDWLKGIGIQMMFVISLPLNIISIFIPFLWIPGILMTVLSSVVALALPVTITGLLLSLIFWPINQFFR